MNLENIKYNYKKVYHTQSSNLINIIHFMFHENKNLYSISHKNVNEINNK